MHVAEKGGRKVPADPRLAEIPVIVVTGTAFEGEIFKAYNLDVSCYITKPIDIPQFMKVVRAIPRFQIAVVTAPPSADTHA